jgi:hypothetical protein
MAEPPRLPERLIQLVPRFRPDADGLGEFALCLGDALYRRFGVSSDYVVWQPARALPELPTPGGAGFPHRIHRVEPRRPRVMAEMLAAAAGAVERPVLLLHFTSYAFSTEGIAWWLPGVLRRFIDRGGRVVGFFHESYAPGRFPNKTWFSSGLQRRIFRQTLALSCVGLTSNQAYLDQMARDNAAGIPLVLAGIPSNVGEMEILPAMMGRTRRLAVFGQHPNRRWLYEQHLPTLLRVVAHLGIEEVADIGAPGDWPRVLESARTQFEQTAQVRFTIHGALPAAEVGELLAGSLAGAVNYRYGMHLKSGIVAAYQAYGLPVILFHPAGDPAPAGSDATCLTPDQVLEQPSGSEALAALLAGASHAGFEFYRENRSYDAVLGKLLPWLRVK